MQHLEPNNPVIVALRQEINEVVQEIHEAIEMLMRAQGKALQTLDARLTVLEEKINPPDTTHTGGKEI